MGIMITNIDSDEDYDKKAQEDTIAMCDFLVQQILKDFPKSANKLCGVLLDFKYELEEGIGQKP